MVTRGLWILLLFTSGVVAGLGASSSDAYLVLQDSVDSGGGRSASTNYSVDGLFSGMTGVSQTAGASIKFDSGFAGQLSEDDVKPPPAEPSISFIPDQTSLEDTAKVVFFTVSDAETPAANLVVTATSANPALVLNSSIVPAGTGLARSVNISPLANGSGISLITVTVTDEANNSSSRTFDFVVNPVNDLPVSESQIVTTSENHDITIRLRGIDPEDDSLVFRVVTGPAKGMLFGTAPNFTYSPSSNVNGSDSFTFVSNDGDGDSEPATVTITIQEVNQAPTLDAIADYAILEDGGELVVPLTGISAGPVDEVQTISISAISSNENLIENLNVEYTSPNAAANIRLSPAANSSGETAVTVTVTDDGGTALGGVDTFTRDFEIVVTAINDLPTISPLAPQATDEDTPITLAFAVGDVESDVSSLTLNGSSSNTLLVPNGNLAFDGTGADRTLLVTPAANLSGMATVSITVSDRQGGQASESLELTVNAMNDPPAANDQDIVVDQAVAEEITLTGRDVETSTLTFSLLTQPNKGTLTGVVPDLIYTPNAGSTGTDGFTFSVNDSLADSDPGTVSITINAVSDVISIGTVSDQSVAEDTAIQVDFSVSLTGTSSESLVVVGSSSDQTLVPDANIVSGGVDLNRSIVITPASNQFGQATITVTVSDDLGNAASRSFVLTVLGVNDLPFATSLEFATEEDQALTLRLEGTDVENEALVFSIVSQPSKGVLSGTAPNLTFKPNADANGNDSFTFSVNDGNGDSDPTTVLLTIHSVNDAPHLDDIEDQVLSEDGGEFTIALTGIGAGPSDEVQAIKTSVAVSNESVIETPVLEYTSPDTTGTLRLTPIADTSGEVTVTITLQDDGGSTLGGIDTVSETFTVAVDSVNDLPTISVISDQTVDEDVSSGVLAFTVSDVETDSASLVVNSHSSNPALINTTGIGVAGNGGNRTVTLTPITNQFGTATITLSVRDESGGQFERSFTFTVVGVNDPPTMSVFKTQSTNEDIPRSVSFTVGDVETVVENLILSGTSSNSALVPDSNLSFGGVGEKQAITVTPVSDFSGTTTITVKVDDGQGRQVSHSFEFLVNAVNDVPVADAQNVVTDAKAAKSIVLTGSDAEGSALTFTVNNQPANAVLSGVAPNLNYTPNADAVGEDSFTFTVNDGTVDSDPAIVRISINAVSDLITISDIPNQSTQEDTARQIDFTVAAQGGVTGDLTLSASSSDQTLASDENLILGGSDGTHTLVLIPAAHQFGTALITLKASDDAGQVSSRTFEFTVSPVNDLPAAETQIVAGMEDRNIPIQLTGNDIDNDSLTYRVVDHPANGILSGTPPNLTYSPDLNTNGNDVFTFVVNDGAGDSSPATVNLKVESVNDPPTLDALPNVTAREDDLALSIDLTGITPGSANESQIIAVSADSSNRAVVDVSSIEYSSPSVSATVILTLVSNSSGEADITVTVQDDGGTGDGGVDAVSQSFRVFVNSVNDLPTITATTNQTIDEDSSVSSIALTLGDEETPVDQLNLSAETSNPSVVDVSGIVFGGSGAHRSVAITPVANQFGIAAITVSVNDGSGGESSRSFLVTVLPVNDFPSVSQFSSHSTLEDTEISVSFTISDIETLESNLALSGTSSNSGIVPDSAISFSGTGRDRTVTVTPAANQTGTLTITLTVADGHGGEGSASFALSVIGVDDPPLAISQNVVTDQGVAKDITLSGTDLENDSLAFVVVSQPSKGVLSGAAPDLTYTPSTTETGVDSFTFQVNDGTLDSDLATVLITINAVSDVLDIGFIADHVMDEDTVKEFDIPLSATGSLVGNVSGDGVSSNPTLISESGIELLRTATGFSVSMTPASNQHGETTITLSVYDEGGNSISRSFVLKVAPVNDLPVPAPQHIEMLEDQVLSLQLQGSDVENDPISFQIVSHPLNGILSGTAPNLIYTPNIDFNGSDSLAFAVNDGGVDSGAETVSLIVKPVNDPPSLTPIGDRTVTEDSGELTIVLSGISAGPPNETQGITINALSEDESIISVSGVDYSPSDITGILRLTPTADANGEVIVTVVIKDSGGTDEGGVDLLERDFKVAVSGLNDVPVISSIVDQTVEEDGESEGIAFFVSDKETEAKFLVVSADSSDPALIDQEGIEFGGVEGSRIVKLTPQANRTGVATITLTVTDAEGARASQSFVLSVGRINDLPVVGEISGQIIFEDNATGTILFTVQDQETPADELEVSAVSSDQTVVSDTGIILGGSRENRSVQITPVKNAFGSATITVSARDTDGAVSELSFLVTVVSVNDAPVIEVVAGQIVQEDAGFQTVILNGITPGADSENSQTISLTVTSSNPELVPDPVVTYTSPDVTAVLTYTPVANGNGTAVITIVAVDDGGTANEGIDSLTTNFTVTVDAINDPPVIANIDDLTVNEDNPILINVSATDPESAASALTYSLATGSPDSASIDSTTGEFTWTPSEAQGPGTFPITVQATDDASPPLTGSASFTVTVNEVNVSPLVSSISSQTIAEGSNLNFNVSASDSDIPSNNLSFSLGSGPVGASISSDGSFSWTPGESDGPGSFSVNVQVSDGSFTASGSFSVNVTEENTHPSIGAISSVTVDEGNPVSFLVSATDTDLPAQALSFSLLGAPPGASISPSGEFSWTPTEAQGPGTFPMTMTATDSGPGNLSARADFTVTVNELNSAPLFPALSDQGVQEGQTLSFVASGFDSDQPAQGLTYSLQGAPEGAAIDPISGLFSWTPTEAQGPSQNQFTITVTDEGPGNLTVSQTLTANVFEINEAPVLDVISDQAIGTGETLTFTASGTDPDVPANTLIYSLIAGPPGGTIDAASGLFTWTPNFTAADTTVGVTIQVADGGSPPLSATQSFTVTVTSSNKAPLITAVPDQTLDEGSPLGVAISVTDTDVPAQTITFSLAPGAPAGASIDANGQVTWTPSEEDGPGSVTLTVQAQDNGSPPLNSSQSFSVLVNEVNVAPTLDPIGDQTILEQDTLTVSAVASDTDLPVNNLSFSLGTGDPVDASIDAATGLFTWTPTVGQGPSSNTITVVVSDGGTPNLSATQTFEVVVKPLNRAPQLHLVADQTVDEGELLSFTIAGTDADVPAQPLLYELVNGPPGAQIDAVTGEFTWTPTEEEGPGIGEFTVQVSDSVTPPLSATSTFTVTVNEVNLPPVVESVSSEEVTVNEGETVSVTVTASDPDLPANILTYSLDAGAPEGSTIDPASGVFSWTPSNAQGPSNNAITVVVTDDGTPALTVKATFTVVVNEINSPPTLLPIADQTVEEGSVLTFVAAGTDTDLPAQDLSYSLAVGSPEGASIDPLTGIFTWTPGEIQGPFTGTISVRVTDNGTPIGRASQEVNIEVAEANIAPVLEALSDQVVSVTAVSSDTLTVTATAKDADLPANVLQFSLTAPPAGAAIDGATGVFTWTPTIDQVSAATVITVLVTDDGPGALTHELSFSVEVKEGVNLPPELSAISDQTVPESGSTPGIAFTLTDADTPLANFTIAASSSNTDLIPESNITLGGVGENRSVQVKPLANQSGTATVTLTASEPAGGQVSTSFAVTVAPVAPAFVKNLPAEVTVPEGGTLDLSVTVSGSQPIAYVWTKDGVELPGKRGAVLSLSGATIEDAGSYAVQASNSVIAVDSDSTQVIVVVPLRIVDQPVGQKVLVGANVSFAVSAVGDGTLTFQWTKDGLNIPDATGDTLSLGNVEAILAGSYSVAVSDTSGSVTSTAAVLEVIAGVGITAQPESQELATGESATMTVAATGTEPIRYQWQFNGIDIGGETQASLTLSNLVPENSGDYSVVVSNEGGSATSAAAALTVSIPPTITQQPLAKEVLAGTPVTFEVTVSGTEPLTYQWAVNGSPIDGAVGRSLSIPTVTVDVAGDYGVIVTNGAGSATSDTATLVVVEGVVITAEPQDQTVTAGEGASFSVTATGTAPLSFQWQFQGVNIEGANGSSLSLGNVQAVDAGSYQVVVSNVAGPVVSAAATLTVNVGVTIVAQPQNATLTTGQSVTISVLASGTPAPTYQWQLDGTDLPGATGPSLSVSNVTPANAGTYTVVVQNVAGTVTSSGAILTVITPPTIVTQPQGQTVDLNGSVSFSVVAAGDTPLSYQWQKNGGNISGENSESLTIPSARASDAGSYAVVVENSGGAVTSESVSLSVNLPAIESGNSAASVPPPFEDTFGSFDGGNNQNGGGQVARRNAPPATGGERWYAWRAPSSGIATFDTAGSTFDTVLSVYTGTADALTLIAEDDDRGGFLASKVQFNATVGTEYLFSVKGFGNAAGQIVVSFDLQTTSQQLPVLAVSPQSLVTVAGSDVNFTVAATGTDLVYQWLSNGVEISGETGSTLQLSNVQDADAMSYAVRVTSLAGAANPVSVESLPALLHVGTVNSLSADKFLNAPRLTGGAAVQSVNERTPIQSRSLRAAGAVAEGFSGTLAFSTFASAKEQGEPNHCAVVGGASRWITYVAPEDGVVRFATEGSDFDTVLSVYSGTSLSGLVVEGCDNNSGTDGTASAVNVQVTAGNQYFIAIDGVGSATGLVRLNYEFAKGPEIAAQPQGVSVSVGEQVVFFVQTAAPVAGATVIEPTYQWTKDGFPLPGETANNLTRASVILADAGEYAVVVSNFAGSTTSDAVRLDVSVPLSITTQPASQSATAGDPVNFSVIASGSAPITYQWQLDGTDVAGATAATYQIASAQVSDEGSYTVVVSNPLGSETTSTAALTLIAVPTVNAGPADIAVAVGEQATLTVDASGTGTLSYQWKFNGVDIVGETQPSFVLTNVGPENVGAYTVVVSNETGSVISSAAQIRVEVPFAIVEEPLSQALAAGSTALFSVRVSGSGPFTYQWRLNDADLPAAIEPTLALPNVQRANEGSYRVVVTDSAAQQLVSQGAVLSVSSLPAINVQPLGGVVFAGQDVILSVAAAGSGVLAYQWSLDGDPLVGAIEANLTLGNIGVQGAGIYSVTVSNNAGSVSSELAILTVREILSQVSKAAGVGAASSEFSFRVSVPEGNQARVQVSTDMVNWSDLTPVPVTGIVDVTDPDSVSLEARFYRVIVE